MSGVLQIVRGFVKGAAAIVGVQICWLLVGTLTIMKLGRHGPLELAAASLGNLALNLFGLMLCSAPLFAMDEIAPQAWVAGMKKKTWCGKGTANSKGRQT